MYGQATPGGLINAESKLPTETPLHEIQFGGGNYGRYEGAFDLGGPIDENGQFLYRLTGIGFSENGLSNFNKDQEVAIAPALTWKPDADTSFTVLGKYIDRPSLLASLQVPAYGTVLPNPNGKIPRSFFLGDPNADTIRQTNASIGYELQHRFGDVWSIDQNFRYEHGTSYVDQLYRRGGLIDDYTTQNRYHYLNDETTDGIFVDTQLHADLHVGPLRNQVVFGIYYQRINYNDLFGDANNVAAIDIFAPVYYVPIPAIPADDYQTTHQSQDQAGIYGQDQITFGRWHFLLGARGDWADQTTEQASAGVTTKSSSFNRAPTWRAGLVYLFDNGLAPYMSYSTSFYPQVGTTFAGSPYQPLTGQQYEAGIKYQPPGWNSFITAAVYNLTEQNVLTPDPDHEGYSVQTGEIRVRGAELQAHANLTKNLDLIAAYTYADAVNTKDAGVTDTTIGGVTEPVQGKVPTGAPTQMASLWANYTIHHGPARGLGFGGGVRYIGATYGDDVNSFKVPGFTLFDAALHYDLSAVNPSLKGLKLQVNATNLFDKTYVASCSSVNSCWYGFGRTVYATLTYDW